MSKVADVAKVSAKGSFHLLWGLVASTVISAVGTIFIARLLGSNLYGLYVVVLTVPYLILTFRDWAVNSAMIRCAAQYRAEGRSDEIRNIFVSGLVFEIVSGLVLSVVCFLLSGFLATSVFHRPTIAPLIQIASFFILADGLINAASAAFIGVERLELNSAMLICQSILKDVLIIGLVALGLGTTGATIGFTAGSLLTGVIGGGFMWILYKDLPRPAKGKLEFKAYIGEMLRYGAPLSLAIMLGGFLTQFYAFLLPIYYATDNVAIGDYGIAAKFAVLITFFSTPITTMLFPAFSKLDAKKDKETLKNVFQGSVKYASLFVVPVAALVMCLAEPAVSTLFGSTYGDAPLFLALLAVSYLLTAFGNLSLSSIINGQGQTKFFLYLTLLTATIGFPLGYVLIMNFGVVGLIAASLSDGFPSIIIGLAFVKKHYGVTVDWHSSAKILFSSGVAAASTYAVIAEVGFASWIRLVIGLMLFSVIFVFLAVLTRTVDKLVISNLRDMTGDLGLMGKLLRRILNLMEKKIVKMRESRSLAS